MIDGDNLAVSATSGSFSDKNAATGKTVTLGGISVANTVAGVTVAGYQIPATLAVTADITRAPLTLTALTNTRDYDATTGAAAVPTIAGLVGTDTISGLTESYADKNVGTGKTLSVDAATRSTTATTAPTTRSPRSQTPPG